MVYKPLSFDNPAERIQHLLVVAERENLLEGLDALEVQLEQNESVSEDAVIKHDGMVSGLNRHLSQEADLANFGFEEARNIWSELEELRTKHCSVVTLKGSLETQLAVVRQGRDRQEAEPAADISSKTTQITSFDLAPCSEKDRVASLLRESETQTAEIAEPTSVSTSAESNFGLTKNPRRQTTYEGS